MKTKPFAIILLLLLVHVKLFAQGDFRKGFIITHSNSIIHGEIEYRSPNDNYKSCIFIGPAGRKEYLPDEIKGYNFFNGKAYLSDIVDNKFVEVLINGELSLFQSERAFHMRKDNTNYKLEKNKNSENNRDWKAMVNLIISDCMSDSESTSNNLKFNKNNLIKLAIEYNRCVDSDFVEYKENKPVDKYTFGVVIGFQQSNYEVDQLNKFIGYKHPYVHLEPSYESSSTSIGGLFAYRPPNWKNNFAFQSEMHFFNNSFSSLITKSYHSTYYYDTYVKISTLSVPVSVKYSKPFAAFKYEFFMQGGLNYDYHFKSESRLLVEEIYNDEVRTAPEESALDINSGQWGYWAGIGLQRDFKNIDASLAMRFSQLNEIDNNDGIETSNNRISINLILSK